MFTNVQFYPQSGPTADGIAAGFRVGNKGTHTSRTMMLAELTQTIAGAPQAITRKDFAHAIITENLLGKATFATRKLTMQRLGELYGLDESVQLFRLLRRLWAFNDEARPLLALLVALARDPLLAATATSIFALEVGEAPSKGAVATSLRAVTGDRMNDGILDKVVRNALSSWTQSGHLVGRVRKHRARVVPSPLVFAFAVHLAGLAGFDPSTLFHTAWFASLDLDPESARRVGRAAHAQGLVDYREGAGVVEISSARLLAYAGGSHGEAR